MPLVWLRLVRQPTSMLRGYLNSSLHGVCGTSSIVAGSSTSFGSIISAQAIDWRASAARPLRISQRGDSGTQARINRVISAGARPIAKRARQPKYGAT